MTTIYRPRVVSLNGPHLTLHLDYVYGWDWDRGLMSSRTLALHFLWDPLAFWIGPHLPTDLRRDARFEQARATPIGQELADRDSTDERWNRANVGRFISCVGMV